MTTIQLTDIQKSLLLSQETEKRFGYKPENLSYGSARKIVHKCDVCGLPKESLFREFVKNEKLGHLKCGKEKHERTNLERYGVKHPRQLKSVIESARPKRLQTWLRAQGVECAIEEVEAASLAFLRQEIQKEGYNLLSTQYINATTKMETTCPKGHIYWVKWNDFKSGYRCASCKAENNKVTMEEVQNFLQKEGYEILGEYQDRHSILKYQCPKGHLGQTRWALFKAGHRCPECREWKSQGKLGEILEQIYPLGVKRGTRPNFLRGLELDFLMEEEKLAFEYDGRQHFEPLVGAFGCRTRKEAGIRLQAQQRRDRRKDRLCKKNGYRLIRIAYNERLCIETITQKIGKR